MNFRQTDRIMEYKLNKKAKSEIELIVTYTPEELKAKLEPAAAKISENLEIKGFRPGKAPLEMVIKTVGEMKVYEHAAELLITSSYREILLKEKIEPLTHPKIDLEKLAPGNDFIYKANVTIVPTVEVLGLDEIKLPPIIVTVEDERVQKIVDELQEMTALETLVHRPAALGDKVELNFDVLKENVPIEGGQGSKHPLVLGSNQMIPGFEEQVVGMKAEEEKEFELKFPEKYHSKILAGQLAKFKVKVLNVFQRERAKNDDEFAAKHGQKTFQELWDLIKQNVEEEDKVKAEQKRELEIIEKLCEKSKFSEIPDVLVSQEVEKMINELKHNIEHQNMKWEDYLSSLKKDENALRLDLSTQALKRVKASLLTRAIFLQNNLEVTEKDIDEELGKLKSSYAHSTNVLQAINKPEYRDRLRNILGNSKVMKFLKEKVTNT